MTRRFKISLFVILAAACFACTFAGCKVGGKTREDVLKDYQGAHVTYYANGGLFDLSTTIVVRDLYFAADNVPFYEIPQTKTNTTSGNGLVIKRNGYDLIGWFGAARYSEGEFEGEVMYTYTYKEGDEEITVPVYPVHELNSDGSYKKNKYGEYVYHTDNEHDRPMFAIEEDLYENEEKYITELNVEVVVDEDMPFTSDDILKGDEELVVCAKWEPAQRIVYKLIYDGEEKIAVSADEKYGNGEIIYEYEFGSDEYKSPLTISPINLSSDEDVTFVGNYLDEECTQYVTSSTRVSRPENGEDLVIYTRYITGDWEVVSSAVGVADMFTYKVQGHRKYILACDIDCSTQTRINLVSTTGQKTACVIDGNGRTLSNLNFGLRDAVKADSETSVFGTIGATAQIKDLTLKNVKVTLKGPGDYSINFYAICMKAEEGAKIENLKIDGITATLTNAPYVRNFDEDSHWLFGGVDSDEEFIQKYKVELTGKNSVSK